MGSRGPSLRRLARSAVLLFVTSLPLSAWAETDVSAAPPSATSEKEKEKESAPNQTFFRLSADRWSIEITDSDQANAAVLTKVPLYQSAQDLQRLGAFAFVLNETHGVTVLDLRDPAQPVKQLLLALRWVRRMELQNASRLVLTMASSETYVFDVSNPSQPKRVEQQRTGTLASGVTPAAREWSTAEHRRARREIIAGALLVSVGTWAIAGMGLGLLSGKSSNFESSLIFVALTTPLVHYAGIVTLVAGNVRLAKADRFDKRVPEDPDSTDGPTLFRNGSITFGVGTAISLLSLTSLGIDCVHQECGTPKSLAIAFPLAFGIPVMLAGGMVMGVGSARMPMTSSMRRYSLDFTPSFSRDGAGLLVTLTN